MMLSRLASEHDTESYAIDASYERVHGDGTRGRIGGAAQAIWRLRGGLTSEVHLLNDAFGYPVRLVINGGGRNDFTQAPALPLPGTGAQVLIVRSYDSNW